MEAKGDHKYQITVKEHHVKLHHVSGNRELTAEELEILDSEGIDGLPDDFTLHHSEYTDDGACPASVEVKVSN